MKDYSYPEYEFAAPIELASRMDKIPSPEEGYRSVFMRDRDRVLYSSAFRRLGGKTQIYLAGKDDNRRNRLTHTLEVSQIARTISQALGLDCDLTEAIALAHDLGHTPFGHAGEQILHEIMVPSSPVYINNSPMNEATLAASPLIHKPLYGFKHNIQSVRVAALKEDNYGEYGLNLTNFTLWGIQHHSTDTYKEGRVNTTVLDPSYKEQFKKYWCIKNCPECEAWSFEAFVVREADEIAQWHHDLEDALRGNAMSEADVCSVIHDSLEGIMDEETKKELQRLSKKKTVSKQFVGTLSRIVVNTLVSKLIECSLDNLNALWEKYVKTAENRAQFFIDHKWNEPEVFQAIGYTRDANDEALVVNMQSQYPSAIREKIHHSCDVVRMNAKGQYIIKKLFQAYFSHPQQLPDGAVIRYLVEAGVFKNINEAEKKGVGAARVRFEEFLCDQRRYDEENQIRLMRFICDHIASMTDNYAIKEYNELYG